MVRSFRIVVLALALACGLAVAPGASALVVHSRDGQFLGVAPHAGLTAAQVPGAVAAPRAAVTAASGANLNYQGGPVLHSSSPYVVFWAPGGDSVPADSQALIQRYFSDVASDSGSATNVYAVTRQFTDAAGFADYRKTFDPAAQVITDTNAYPARDAANCGASQYASCVTDAQLQAEVSSLIAADGLPSDGSTSAAELPDAAPVYFVVLPSDVDVCFSDGSGTCASNYFCAYHSSYVSGADNVLYAAIPTVALDNAQDAKACQADGNPLQDPNGSLADVALKYISHEDSETITDPLGNGWWNDYSGNEDGDNCNESFDPALGGSADAGTLYNQLIAGHPYYLQSEWSNGDSACRMQPSSGTITPRFGVPSGPRAAGSALSFDPSTSAGTNRYTSETWDFGDGSPSSFHAGRTLTSPSHTYAAAGNYTVTLTLVDNRGNMSRTSEQIAVGTSPVAALSASATTIPEGSGPVSFDAGASTDSGGSINSYAWDFGDGASAQGAAASHSYATAGRYLVRLTVTDSLGRVDTATSTVTVTDEPPSAAFSIATPSPEAGGPVGFDGTSSSDSDGSITAYAWSFGDGARGSGSSPTHTYAAAGTYSVSLTVTDSTGQRSTVTHQLTVTPGPAARFSVSPAQPVEGAAAGFDARASSAGAPGASLQTYSWSFGDGATATGDTATHTYTAAGTYTVKLTVTDTGGASNSTTQRITVADEPPVAAFAVTTPVPVPSAPAGFDGGASSDPDGGVVSYRWDFGDGTTGTGAAPSHTYTYPGAYTVQLTVTDSAGAGATVSRPVTVHAEPQAIIGFSPTLPLAQAPTSFSGAGSLDPDATTTISSYHWSFGDGAEATGQTPAHTFARAGTYTVWLTVTNGLGLTDTTSRQVTVAAAAPTPSIAVESPAVIAGGPVAFSGASPSDPQAVVSYVWRFGDGAGAVGRTVTHTYARPGTYVVTLTVRDSAGHTTVTTRTITVTRRGHITSVAVRISRTGATVLISVDRAGRLSAAGHVVVIRRAGTARIPLRLSRSQLRAVRLGRRVKIRVGVRFSPRVGRLATASAVVAFQPAAGAHGHIAAVLAGH